MTDQARQRAGELADRVCLDPRYTKEMPDDQAEVLTDLIEAYDAQEAALQQLREALREHRRAMGGNVWGDEAHAMWAKATARLWATLDAAVRP